MVHQTHADRTEWASEVAERCVEGVKRAHVIKLGKVSYSYTEEGRDGRGRGGELNSRMKSYAKLRLTYRLAQQGLKPSLTRYSSQATTASTPLAHVQHLLQHLPPLSLPPSCFTNPLSLPTPLRQRKRGGIIIYIAYSSHSRLVGFHPHSYCPIHFTL